MLPSYNTYNVANLHFGCWTFFMQNKFELENLPDVRDGLNRKERAILYCLHELQKELRGRNAPTIMLYGRVVEKVDISESEFQQILSRFAGLSKLGR